MLEENASDQQAIKEKKSPERSLVRCFVCKQEVDTRKAKQLHHALKKKVWVCEVHIK